jgi:DNA (cytosine-5)-methyltransferase 1
MLKTIDLFAGIGGIRMGFENAGFQSVFSNDFEPMCKQTYDLNFETSKLHIEDIRNINPDTLPDFDFLLGGFPCQAFSIAGHRQGFDDDKNRGNLFFYIAKILEIKQPTGFLLENVKNLLTHDHDKTFQTIQKILSDLGYHVKYQVLNTMNYGNVPQNRERIYIVGFKSFQQCMQFSFPTEIPLTKKITDILEPAPVADKYYYDGKPLYDRVKNDVIDMNTVYQWRRQYVRENKKNVCPTLTANMGTGGHNVPIIKDSVGIRKLTPLECLRLQGFPDSYLLPQIADSALYKQIGNSVSVPVIGRIAEQIVRTL